MTAVMSPTSSSSSPPPAVSSPLSNNPNHPALPPLVTSPPNPRRSAIPRPMSHASKNRLSQYSTTSAPRSRPTSHAVFPMFPSSLPYTLVRDFAYPVVHPMHYGPPPEPSQPPSGLTTPASESQPKFPEQSSGGWMSWESAGWGSSSDGHGKGSDLPPIQFADGPPWSEDEDLQSPVVSSRHRKHKSSSSSSAFGRREKGASNIMNPENYDQERGYYVGTSGDGSERYYVNQGGEANGPGGEFVTYPPEEARHAKGAYQAGDGSRPRQFDEGDGYRSGSDASSDVSSPDLHEYDQSRYSRDYQFTITSPDEEMHGKAVALFDFERENENELPLVEGQIIWVSYRHGQGWLVAMDPKTQESGLVPEEYVRLLRDIEGGMTSLTGQVAADGDSTMHDGGTPTQSEHPATTTSTSTTNSSTSTGTGAAGTSYHGHTPTPSTSSANGYHQPIVSTFSTSSKDLDPYPQHLLLAQAGQPPPQVIHYHGQRGGSQANTPTTALYHHDGSFMMRRGSADAGAVGSAKKSELPSSSLNALLEALPPEKVSERPEEK